MTLALQLLALGLTVAFFYLYIGFVFRRLYNVEARVHRLEQMEDARHGFDKAMAEKENKNMLKLRCKPDENCKHCHGRGHVGRNAVTGLFVGCVCCT